MFEKSLTEKLKKIFDVKKVTFDQPSESREQECIFIQVETCTNTIKDAKAIARVQGQLKVFCDNEKLPYGYFSKKINEASNADTKDLFFFDMEENSGYYGKLSERTLSFIYFFSSQYSPKLGNITSLITIEGS